jgi:hypothetical protein
MSVSSSVPSFSRFCVFSQDLTKKNNLGSFGAVSQTEESFGFLVE